MRPVFLFSFHIQMEIEKEMAEARERENQIIREQERKAAESTELPEVHQQLTQVRNSSSHFLYILDIVM